MKLGDIIILWIVIVLIVIGITGLILLMIADDRCKDTCEEMGAIGYYTSHSGNWKIDDTCVCFWETRIKSFRLGE